MMLLNVLSACRYQLKRRYGVTAVGTSGVSIPRARMSCLACPIRDSRNSLLAIHLLAMGVGPRTRSLAGMRSTSLSMKRNPHSVPTSSPATERDCLNSAVGPKPPVEQTGKKAAGQRPFGSHLLCCSSALDTLRRLPTLAATGVFLSRLMNVVACSTSVPWMLQSPLWPQTPKLVFLQLCRVSAATSCDCIRGSG